MDTFLMVLAVVFGIVICLGLAIAPMVWAVDYDSGFAFLLSIVWACVVIAAGIALALHFDDDPKNANNCADKGGVWTRVGEHPVLVGKVYVQSGEYACVEAK